MVVLGDIGNRNAQRNGLYLLCLNPPFDTWVPQPITYRTGCVGVRMTVSTCCQDQMTDDPVTQWSSILNFLSRILWCSRAYYGPHSYYSAKELLQIKKIHPVYIICCKEQPKHDLGFTFLWIYVSFFIYWSFKSKCTHFKWFDLNKLLNFSSLYKIYW